MSDKVDEAWMVLNSAWSRPIIAEKQMITPCQSRSDSVVAPLYLMLTSLCAGEGSRRRAFRQSREAAVAARFVRASEDRNNLVMSSADLLLSLNDSRFHLHHRSVGRQ